MTDAVPPIDIQAEEQVLGASMTRDNVLGAIQAEVQLRPDDFYYERHGSIFAAMLRLVADGKPTDEITVVDALKQRGDLDAVGGRAYLSELATKVNGWDVVHHAERLRLKARWRQRLHGARLMAQAALTENDAEFAQAQTVLTEGLTNETAIYDEDRQRDIIFELLEGQSKPEFFWPFDKLNRLQSGGMRRGQLIVLSGYTNFGKSHLASQVLDSNRKHGRVALYDNEMGVDEIAVRRMNRQAGIPYSAIMGGSPDERQRTAAMRFLNKQGMGWPIVKVAGWSVDEVCHHIRQFRWDLVVIDLLHNFPFSEERELADMVRRIKMTGKQANCTIVLCAHVSRKGADGGKKRPPILSDLRWSGEIENMADVVCFVHREQEDEAPFDPLPESHVYFAKCKGGKIGAVKTRFDDRHLRFEAEGLPGVVG